MVVVVRFGKSCGVIIDEGGRDVRVTDARTAVVKVVFDEDWKVGEVLVNGKYLWRKGE